MYECMYCKQVYRQRIGMLWCEVRCAEQQERERKEKESMKTKQPPTKGATT